MNRDGGIGGCTLPSAKDTSVLGPPSSLSTWETVSVSPPSRVSGRGCWDVCAPTAGNVLSRLHEWAEQGVGACQCSFPPQKLLSPEAYKGRAHTSEVRDSC